MDQNQRQNKDSEPLSIVRNNGRITRGHSDLPKQEPKVVSESESQEQDVSDSTPKQKKIHHMTLKKLERLQKLAEMERQGLIKPQPKVEKLPPRKRGRPKGATKKVLVESEIQSFHQPSDKNPVKTQKKDIILRKRENTKKMIEEASQQMIEEKNQLKSVEIQIIIPQKSIIKPLTKPEPKPEVKSEVKAEQPALVPPTGPKKRGRKKKIQPMLQQNPLAMAQSVAPKIFTVPKAQTYDNYNKYYNKLLAQTKETQEKQLPLIFDKFSDPEHYKRMLAQAAKIRN